jgi:hypothetical protein
MAEYVSRVLVENGKRDAERLHAEASSGGKKGRGAK